MEKNSGPPPIVFILVLLGLSGLGYWWFMARGKSAPSSNVNSLTTENTNNLPSTQAPVPNVPIANNTVPVVQFTPPTNIAPGTTVKIDGSTSMVTINKNLQLGFQAKFPGANVVLSAGGTNQGLQKVLTGNADIAAISRPLTATEQSQGLIAIPVAKDAISIVVGINNPFTESLSPTIVEDIFKGNITNWAQIGGSSSPIRVINRPPVSGTHQAFKELVLKGGNFGTTTNIITWPRDETTLVFRELKNNGITYATYAQVAGNKGTVRSLPINGITPDNSNYPYQRELFYVYKNPPTPQVQSFLGYVTSPAGQQAMLGN